MRVEGRELIVAVGRDITERKKGEEDLRQAVEKLERSNEELERFAYVASHDLQEPLRKVRVFGDMLEAEYGEALADEGRDYLRRMRGAATRMGALINDLLTFSRVKTRDVSFAPVDLGELTRIVVSDLMVRIDETGGTVDVGDLPSIVADPSQMRQLLQNVLGNALKFHRKGVPPVVSIRGRLMAPSEAGGARDAPDGGPVCVLEVTDNGVGFDEAYLERIFAPFQRLHTRTEFDGSGVGLAVCQRIVERHGGRITARSIEGRGSTFVVTLPARQGRYRQPAREAVSR